MSASLVGSEMCIRDRVRGSGALLGRLMVTSTIVVMPMWSRRSQICVSAVSYTHLTLPTICSV
eukprot:325110-Alexandrium_andersonii.AAC.1